MSVKKTGPAILLALALCAGCVTDQTSGIAGDVGGAAIGVVQDAVDVGAAKVGLGAYVAPAREKLAEAEAAKVGRVLLPRGLSVVEDAYLDGKLIDPKRIVRVPRLVGGPTIVVTTNAPADTVPSDQAPADPPPAGQADDAASPIAAPIANVMTK